jgi:Protein of unknown function (DUF1573)
MNEDSFNSPGLQGSKSRSIGAGSVLLALSMASLMALLITLSMVLYSAKASAGEVVTLENTEFNFGQMWSNSFASHTFWIYASGSDTIVIDTVISGCGCTTIPLSKTVLAPGDSVAFEVLFDSKDLIGSVAKKPGFRLKSDSALYSFKFYASALTKEVQFFPLAIMPRVLAPREEAARSGREFPFQIHNGSDEDISISIVDFPAELFRFELPDSIPAEGTITGHFSLLPGYPDNKDIHKSVTFEVNQSELYRLTAPILMKSVKATKEPITPSSGPKADSARQGK